jgi:hypothetical protein
MRLALLTILLLASPFLQASVVTEIRAWLDREGTDLPAKTASLECPGVGEVATKPFECSGSLVDGRLIRISAQPDAAGGLHITSSRCYDRVPDTVRQFLATRVTPAVDTLECPPETVLGLTLQCRGTLTDRSSFMVEAQRNAQEVLEIGPIEYSGDPPGPLVRAVRAYTDEFAPPVTNVRCHLPQQNEAVSCVATLSTGAITHVKVTRLADGTYRAGSELPENPLWKTLRRVAILGLILGPLFILIGTVRLVLLNLRSVVTRVPFGASREVTIEEPGSYALELEAPRFSNARGFNYSLHEAGTAREIPLSVSLLRTQTSGFKRVRMVVRRFSLDRGGRYVLQIHIPPGRDVSRYSAVVSKAFVLQGFLCVALILTGVFMLLAGVLGRL